MGRRNHRAGHTTQDANAALRVGLDSSVVVRLLTGEPPSLALAALRRVEEAHTAGVEILASDLVVSECYLALQHHYGVAKAHAIEALRGRFARESPLRSLGAAAAVLERHALASRQPGFVDRLIHAEFVEEVEEMWTFERAGAKLAETRLLGP